MGKWELFQNERGYLSLTHTRLADGVISDCGELLLETPATEIVAWIMSTEAAAAGDVIRMHGQTLAVGQSASA